MPQFSVDWFSDNIPQWRRLFEGLGWEPDTTATGVEIGAYEGRSTLWILENLLRAPDSVLHCIDTFEGGVEHAPDAVEGLYDRFQANIAEAPGGDKVRVHRDRSSRALVDLLANEVRAHFVYVDGSHQAPDVLTDLVLAFQLMAPGAVMICDDYLWSQEGPGAEDVLNSPKLAIDAFTTIHRRKLTLIPNFGPWQLACVKTQD